MISLPRALKPYHSPAVDGSALKLAKPSVRPPPHSIHTHPPPLIICIHYTHIHYPSYVHVYAIMDNGLHVILIPDPLAFFVCTLKSWGRNFHAGNVLLSNKIILGVQVARAIFRSSGRLQTESCSHFSRRYDQPLLIKEIIQPTIADQGDTANHC